MAYLLLDLDETAIVAEGVANQIHPAQQLSSRPYTAPIGPYFLDFYIINPKLLSDLIRVAYEEFDGVIIFTAGRWSHDIRSVLAYNLNLSDECREKLIQCPFHSAVTDGELFNLDTRSIRRMSKGERFNKILEVTPEFRDKGFVMLDDNPFHIDSFKQSPNVCAVLAGTGTEDQTFYEAAKAGLRSCKMVEMEYSAVDILANMKGPAYTLPFFNPAKSQQEAIYDEEKLSNKNHFTELQQA